VRETLTIIRQVLREESMSHRQVFEWKSPDLLRSKKARQAKSKIKGMLIIFFDIKRIIQKEFILAEHTAYSAYYYVL
jgi:hypothetical protein